MTDKKNQPKTNGHVGPNDHTNGSADSEQYGAILGTEKASSRGQNEGDRIRPGKGPLPSNPGEFVDQIHRRVDLFEVWKKLLKSKDKKIKQRAVEKLTEMRYKGAAALADEPQQIVNDIDSAVARRA